MAGTSRARDGLEPDGDRVVRTLRRLAEQTSDSGGAQRVAWTDTWRTARELLLSELSELPVEVSHDGAANIWARLPGTRDETVVIGSHLDSVPDGGWLDGAYGVMSALEVLRVLSQENRLPCSVALVDWADEEGARFGRSLFGSAAAVGTLDVAEIRDLTDRDGERLVDVLARWGVDVDGLAGPLGVLDGVAAYLEAHIEQGPVLEHEGIPIAAVTGTAGVQRHRVTFHGESAHSGSTPMDRRRDSFMAAATTALAVRDAAIRHGGVGTVGVAQLRPGIATAVPGETSILVDQRHHEADPLLAMLEDARAAAQIAADAGGCTVDWQPVFHLAPRPFDARIVAIARDSCAKITGHPLSVHSGALHDATEISQVVPTGMVFASSMRGVSHSRYEDSDPAHLKLGVTAYYDVVRRVMEHVGAGDEGWTVPSQADHAARPPAANVPGTARTAAAGNVPGGVVQ